jgi:hypothetical protein
VHRSLKRNLVIGLAALALAAFAGGAYAATQNSGPTTRQAFLNDVAKRLHVTPQQLAAALDGATADQLQALVNAGKLTQAQANALQQRLKNGGGVPAFPVGPLGQLRRFAPYGPGGAGGAGGPGGPGGPGGFGPGFPGPGGKGFAVPAPGSGFGRGFGRGFGGLSGALTYLGLTGGQLLQQLSSGKSLAQIATSKGKTVAGLEQAMTTAEKNRLDKLVTAKVITQAQENQILKRWSASLSQRVNSKGFGGPGQSFRLFKLRPARPVGPGFAVPAPKNAPARPGSLPKQQAVPAPGAGLPQAPATPVPSA